MRQVYRDSFLESYLVSFIEVTSIVLAAVAGFFLGALAVVVRWGLGRGVAADLGAFAAAALATVACAIVATPSVVHDGVDPGRLWPFLAVGLLAPGASQVCLTQAVRLAGSSRAAIVMGCSPMLSVAIAFSLLGEALSPLLLGGTVLIVAGGGALAAERARPARFHPRGMTLALLCAALFAARDTLVRLGARDLDPPTLQAATATLLGAAICIAIYLATRRTLRSADLRPALVAFAPAGVALAGGYGALLAAYAHGSVTVVSPLAATGSLWAVALALVAFRSSEQIGKRVVVASLLVVAGGAIVGACA
jgi:drug/metabolite transporter (DMT)-like permease